ncbi:Excinuclease ABC subunit C [Fulvivirga imtechensis AK7]|uniref:UvrABC system protein C n=1 Tax=Fulvivirga imtechensis AK7 TaxID=1237149 RepID=L8JLT2_9BACT|nr:excinuclease ABC subunit UvrC [Fulvivirga imtechensis]ELR69891.1 Excinuclease ABC subunit C [Fulvivirga imtechensis AK7]
MEVPRYSIEQRSSLPNAPGVYKFFTTDNELVYVGKAKNIKKRVNSYFSKSHQLNRKTRKLISEIHSMEFALANSEFDALLLENNLIKQNQPKYNILLKDDKTFPYICIVNERFPRIISTRKFDPSFGEYFGPFSSVVAMKNVLDLLRKLYTIRTCKLNLSEKNIELGKFKICLEYHIGNCKGPCENLQSLAEYNTEIEQAKNILKGNLSIVRNHFKEQMLEASKDLNFEVAQRFKDKIDLLDKFQTKSTVVNPKLSELDVFTIVSEKQVAFVNYLQIKNGAIILAKTVEIKKKLEESDEDILGLVAVELRDQHSSEHKEIVSNVPLVLTEHINNTVPKIGDKRKLVELSLKNALEYKREKLKSSGKQKKNETLMQLKMDLRLPEIPEYIECFDNSNLQGTTPVASMVCFKDGKPSKKDYRHFNIKTVEGANDFASMKEIVYRRYRRLQEEDLPLPQLIVIDGGKGQLSSACEALREISLYGKIPIIGIAKRLEEIYFPEDSVPIHINKKSPSLFLLQRVRDEAHRFAITFHRQKRSKASFNTELESIKGIGKETTDKLLKQYKSTRKIKELSLKQLSEAIGASKAQLVFKHFHN